MDRQQSRAEAPVSRWVSLLTLLLMATALPAVESFQASLKNSRYQNPSALYSFSPPKSSTPPQRLPAWITRPYKRDASTMINRYNGIDIQSDANKDDANQLLMDGELLVGRLAMVGGVLLITREIVTGASFQEQLQQTLSTLS